MGNTYFRFKEFTVHQQRSAMKVCTDACLFGAWVANSARGRQLEVLDAGTGTGLLALMLAQKTSGYITGVEIDADAAAEAQRNFLSSPWAGRLNLVSSALQDYTPNALLDLIVCNPPFFKGDLTSPDRKRTIAMHGNTLTLDEILEFSRNALVSDGRLAILLPARREEEFERLLSERNYGVMFKCAVRQSPTHAVFRIMYQCGPEQQPALLTTTSEIIIRENGDEYSESFRHLLRDYYLYL